jgi:hypothetical protein
MQELSEYQAITRYLTVKMMPILPMMPIKETGKTTAMMGAVMTMQMGRERVLRGRCGGINGIRDE